MFTAGRTITCYIGKASPWGFMWLSWGTDWGNIPFISFELMQGLGCWVLGNSRRRGHCIFTDPLWFMHTLSRKDEVIKSRDNTCQFLSIFGLREAHPLQHHQHFLRLKQLLRHRKKILYQSLNITPTNWTTGLFYSTQTRSLTENLTVINSTYALSCDNWRDNVEPSINNCNVLTALCFTSPLLVHLWSDQTLIKYKWLNKTAFIPFVFLL